MESEIPLLCSQINPFHTVPSYVVMLYFNIILACVPSDMLPFEDLCSTGSSDYYYGAKLERRLTNVARRMYGLKEIVHKTGKKIA
jgi:hypothetical protein